MDKNKCEKWDRQLRELREKHAEFRQVYADGLQFAEENPGVRETAFGGCRGLFGEIKVLVLTLREDFLPSIKYEKLVNRLIFSSDTEENARLREKLLEMVSEENYDEAVATAKELDPAVKVPAREEIIKNLFELGREKLEKIATIMSKPELIIVPDKSFVEMKDAMDANRHYEGQVEANLREDYEWSGRLGKVSVSILDMVQYPAVVPDQRPGEQRDDEQLRICEKYFRDNGMCLVGDRQYVAGMQKSLRSYERAKKNGETNPEEYILDFFEDSQQTVTIFNQEHVSVISKFAFGYFNPYYRKVYFVWDDPVNLRNGHRGRGAVLVLEI
jgi:hypothetical protein